MADPAEKLRRRAPPRRVGPARIAGGSGDLFEHFGVGGERVVEPPAAIVAAEPCPRCGWLCRADEASGEQPGRCPLCAAPRTISTGSG